MHVAADEDRLVAGLREHDGKCRHGERSGAIADDAAGLRRLTGQQGVARRNAGGNRGVGAAEERALGGECVELRRAHDRVADARHAVAAHLVGHDEEDVGPGRDRIRRGGRDGGTGNGGHDAEGEATEARKSWAEIHSGILTGLIDHYLTDRRRGGKAIGWAGHFGNGALQS